MQLRQLRQFVALAETLNFHRAAKQLNISQPPLSVSIRKLEEELGVELFQRRPRGVALSDAARASLPLAREALRAAEAFAHAVRETQTGAIGQLRIGSVGSATYALVPAAVQAFRKRYPRVELSLLEATSAEIIRDLQDHSLDIGFIRTPLLHKVDITSEPLFSEKLMLIVPNGHPLSGQSRVRLEDLRDEPFVVFNRDKLPDLWAVMMIWCEAAGFLPKVAEQAAHAHTIVALVECGLGVALVPSLMRSSSATRVSWLEVSAKTPAPKVGITVATRPGDGRVSVREFLVSIREAAKLFDTN